jgi:PAP2 superfamily
VLQAPDTHSAVLERCKIIARRCRLTPGTQGQFSTVERVRALTARRPDVATLAAMSIIWFASLITLWVTGLRSAIPWDLGTLLVLKVLPFGTVVLFWAKILSSRPQFPIVAVILGIISLAVFPFFPLWVLASLPLPLVCRGMVERTALGRALVGLLTIVIGYAAVWNANYICGYLVAGRLHDASMVTIELGIYKTLLNVHTAAPYPLLTGWVCNLFENAYLMMFPEVAITVVAMALHRRGELLPTYIRAIFVAYAIALAIFAIFPTIGPAESRPDLVRPDYQSSLTAQLADRTGAELTAVRSGGKLNGIGYFIALPSLHVAQAMIACIFLRHIRTLWWWFLPINALIVPSTVILGQHYLVDVPAGILVGMAAVFLARIFPSQNISDGEALLHKSVAPYVATAG